MTQMTSRLRTAFAGVALLLVLTAPVTVAQTNTENFAQFEFNFSTPGARATGIGSAFISIADDATAAESNPSGLTSLIRPEFSFELKGSRFKREVNNYSHTGTSTSYKILTREFQNAIISPSFASAVVPIRRWVLALFRHELANFETNYYTKGSYVQPLTDGSSFFPIRSELDMIVVNYGAAAAYKISRSFSVGVSAGLSNLSVKSNLSRYYLEVFDPGNLANTALIDDSDFNFFVNLGIRWMPSEQFSLGLVLKRRPTFSLDHAFKVTAFPTDIDTTQTINFNVPSALGLGVSYRPSDVLTLSFDANFVRYSDLVKDFVLTIARTSSSPSDYKVDDALELHLGAEYVWLLKSFGLVFRAGAYNEPDNRIRFAGTVKDQPGNDSRTFSRTVLAALFQPGKTDLHGTFGLGFIFSNNAQFDVAGDLSTSTQQIVGSFVIRL